MSPPVSVVEMPRARPPKRPPDNLPLKLASFIRREKEVAEVGGVLRRNLFLVLFSFEHFREHPRYGALGEAVRIKIDRQGGSMAEPKELVDRLEQGAKLPRGNEERFAGYG